MYHVTNQSAQNARPDWDTIEPVSIANNEKYDGNLLGLPLASFTTTQNEFRNTIDLPTISPYPRNINQNIYTGSYHRVKIQFIKNDHYISLICVKHKVKFNCCALKKHGRNQFEDEVYGILLQHYRGRELIEQTLDTFSSWRS